MAAAAEISGGIHLYMAHYTACGWIDVDRGVWIAAGCISYTSAGVYFTPKPSPASQPQARDRETATCSMCALQGLMPSTDGAISLGHGTMTLEEGSSLKSPIFDV